MTLPLLLLLLLPLLRPGCEAAMTDADRQEALSFHNYLRTHVVPPAADMNAMGWDSRLEELAQRAANTCVFKHNYGGDYSRLGENLYRGSKRSFKEILMLMFLEREQYKFEEARCVTGTGTKYPQLTQCGHYLQIVSASVNRVGCGIAKCGASWLAVCEYERYYSSPPYAAGQPGTLCSHSRCGYHYNGLCYSTFSYLPQAPVPKSSLECKIICSNGGERVNDGMECRCQCPAGYSGLRCQDVYVVQATAPVCDEQTAACSNGGVPQLQGVACGCACPDGYGGRHCQDNIRQQNNSVFWYFGQQMRYNSYYPVDSEIFTRLPVSRSLLYYVTNALNAHCKANYRQCCPEAEADSTTENFVNYYSYSVTDGYPAGVIDGSLKVGIYYKMVQQQRERCNVGISPLVNRNALLAASRAAFDKVRTLLRSTGVTTIRFE